MVHTALGPGISRAGFGTQRWCKLCSLKDATAQLTLDQHLRDGWNATQVRTWLDANYQITVNRQTIYSHGEHVKHPRDRIVSVVQKTTDRALQTRPVATNEQFLEAVRDLAAKKAIENPDEVTIEHGLKAASILANSRRSGGEITLILARVSTAGDYPLDVIEGEIVSEVSNAP